MGLKQELIISKTAGISNSPKNTVDEIVSFEECKKYFDKYGLDDKRIIDIKNNLVGIVDTIMNSYLDNFR